MLCLNPLREYTVFSRTSYLDVLEYGGKGKGEERWREVKARQGRRKGKRKLVHCPSRL